MLKILQEMKIKPVNWLKGAIYAVLIGLVYYSALSYMIIHDWAKEDYSHCMLVPFIVLYLLWEKRREIVVTSSEASWTGCVPFGIGVFFFWLGDLAGEYFTLYISFWLVVVGLLWLHLGWGKIKAMWFALIMMLAMFPFPGFINTRITLQLRLISSKLGVWMLHLYGMSAYREGNVIDLGFTQLQVVDACSGLRYVMPLMVLSLLLAYWFKAHWWKRTVLFLSSIPLAIFVNSFRIAATGVLYSIFGSEVAEGFFHGFSGWLIFMFAIPFLLFEMWVLRRLPPREKEGRGRREGETIDGSGKIEDGRNGEKAGYLKQLMQPMFIVAAAVLLLTFGLSQGIDFRQKVPISKPFSQFPMQIGEWKGAREDMEQQYLDVLKFSDYIMVDYTDRAGKTVDFYVAYYQDQQKGESIHSPETCLPSSGWEFQEAGATQVSLDDGRSPLPVNRSFMDKAGEKELVYYWFPMRGRVLTKLYQLKIYTFWDSLVRQRTDGALVRVITPVYKGEELAEADKRLQGFVRQVIPALDEYIPK
jgi:exosortase D (VPLPA-CTERM-specific)